MNLKIKLLEHAFGPPKYATAGASGMDLYAAVDQEIYPDQRLLIPTGVCIELWRGEEAQIRPRSGLSCKGVDVIFGTVDSDYRGEIKVLMVNHGDIPYLVRRGDRVAQMVFSKIEYAYIEICNELKKSDRNDGGFGSTGR